MENESNEKFDSVIPEDAPYIPTGVRVTTGHRDDNPVVYFEISAAGRRYKNGTVTNPRILGKLHFELRKDLLPMSCENFLTLCAGRGVGSDGVNYHYKGIKIHRVIKNLLFQSGDLLDSSGNCSRSIYNNGGYFCDENYIFRHTGPGCLSYCSSGPNTNGSLFQVCFTQNSDLDGRYVVFGCLASEESYRTLEMINSFGTEHGEPTEELRISNCGIAYPPP